MSTQTLPPDLTTAKVSRSAAIWVAAITALGGFAFEHPHWWKDQGGGALYAAE